MRLDKRNSRNCSILFIVPAPIGISPGQRFRFEHYLDSLNGDGRNYEICSFFKLNEWKAIQAPGNFIRKATFVLAGFVRLIIYLFKALSCDFVYIYREAAPIGPPLFEWLVAKVFRKKIIYDFDDAIWIPVKSEFNSLARIFKNYGKVKFICKWSYKVSVGNDFLGDFARLYCSQVVLIPTVVNTEQAHNRLKNQENKNLVVGWTGSFSTLKYLNMLVPTLKELQTKYDFEFLVIADRDPVLPLKKYRFIRWKRDTEIDDLLKMNIGVMPLYDDDLSKGKCGFKAIQYMSLGIPALVSPVGVNTKIVDHEVNGFVCNNAGEWEKYLTALLLSGEMRKRMGEEARKKIENFYSVNATRELFLNIFKD